MIAARNQTPTDRGAVMVTWLANKFDKNTSQREALQWPDLVALLSEHDRRGDKEGPAWSPATFQGSRHDDNALSVHALVLDIDKLASDSEVKSAIARLEELGLDAVLHTSFNDKVDGLRALRGTVRLSRPVSKDEWPTFWAAAVQSLRIPVGPESKNVGRLWYLPACPLDAQPEVWTVTGQALDVDAVLADHASLVKAESALIAERTQPRAPASPGRLSVEERAERYVDRMPPAISGSGGHVATLKVALALVRGFEMIPGEAMPILESYNRRCDPPWTERELQHKLDAAEQSLKVPLGYLLEEDRQRERQTSCAGVSSDYSEAEPISKPQPPIFKYMTVVDAVDDLLACSALPTVASPFRHLNDLLGGGLVAGQVSVVNGGTGAGKSALIAQLAAFVADNGKPVLFATYELPPRLLIARIVSQRVPGVGWLDCIRGGVTREEMLRHLPVHLRFANRPSMATLKQGADQLAQECGQAPLIIVDYLQLVGGAIAASESLSDLRAANSVASEALRKIADDLKSPMLVVSSVSRQSNHRIRSARSTPPAELVDVAKESGSIEYDAGAVIVLSVEQDEDDEERQIATLTVAKNRFGRTAHLDYRFKGSSGLWTEIGEVEREAKNDLREQILASVEAAGVPLSRAAVIKRGDKKHVRGRKQDILREIDKAIEDGDLQELAGLVTPAAARKGASQ